MPTLDPAIIEKFPPCPFCKEKLDIDVSTPFADDDEIHIELSCGNCDVFFYNTNESDIHNDPEELLVWWNMINGGGVGCGSNEIEKKSCK
jgi:hypothetical protein